jgi:hypothetical protein
VRLRHLSLTGELVSGLIPLAAKDERATLVLINAARDLQNAELILNQPSWLESRIPTIDYTTKLFLVLFCHQDLRSAIPKIQSIGQFFANICYEHNDPDLSIISLVVQNLTVTKALVDVLVRLKLIGVIVVWAQEIGDEAAARDVLEILVRITPVGFSSDYPKMLEFIQDNMESQFALCLSVLVNLSEYPLCAQRLRNSEIEEVVRSCQDDEFADQVQQFLQNLGNPRLARG